MNCTKNAVLCVRLTELTFIRCMTKSILFYKDKILLKKILILIGISNEKKFIHGL